VPSEPQPLLGDVKELPSLSRPGSTAPAPEQTRRFGDLLGTLPRARTSELGFLKLFRRTEILGFRCRPSAFAADILWIFNQRL
jgi:hypothetical protein